MKFLILVISAALMFGGDAEAARKKRPVAVPAFSAKSYIVAEANGTIIKEQNGDSVLPIASITKLMVGIIAAEQDLDEPLSIPSSRQVQSSIPRNVASLTRRELLTLSMVKSDNFAAQILCANIPNCIDRMNSKAQELGMVDTQYKEPTGLDKGNVSTAHDLLRLMVAASADPVLGSISSMPKAEIPVDKRLIKVKNTNPLTSKFDIVLSKTGYTNPAGGCLVMTMNSNVGQRILILLGSRNAKTRIPDMERLVAGL